MLVFCWQPSTYLYVPCLWGRWLELQNNGSDSESSKSENVKKALQCPKQVITCFLGLTWWSWCVLGQALVTKQLSALTFQERKRVYKEALFCHFSRKTGICYTATVSNSVKLKTWNRDNSIQSILPPSLVNLILDMLSGIPWHLTVFPWHFLLDTTSLGIKAFPRLHNHIHLPWQSQSHEDAVFFFLRNMCQNLLNITQTVCMHPVQKHGLHSHYSPLYLSAFVGQNVYILSVALEGNETVSEFKESLVKDVAQSQICFGGG